MDLSSLNNGFGPLCKTRNDKVITGLIVLCLLFFIILIEAVTPDSFQIPHARDDPLHLLAFYSSMVSSLLLGEFFRRLALFGEEVRHADERYYGSKLKASKSCMTYGKSTKIVYWAFFFTTIIPIFYHWKRSNLCFPAHIYVTHASLSSVVLYTLGAKTLSQAELSYLTETENKNIADGLAWSYYFGYLKLVLPHLDTQIEKAVAPEFEVDGSDMRDKITARKVFIIISKDCALYKGLIKVDEEHIRSVQRLPARCMTRGGVDMRPYQHSPYEVKVDGKEPMYLMLEYATPLLSMNDMSNDDNAGFSKQNRDQQVVAFYNKLKFILDQDKEIADKYELILLADVKQDLAKVIYETVHSLKLQ